MGATRTVGLGNGARPWDDGEMLIRNHDDAGDDETRWRSFVQSQGFGHFVASGRDRDIPVIVPTQFLLDGDRLVFHLARANPVFEALAENPQCVMSVAGDWAYIPGAWKAINDEDPALGIPTTYYGAVQLTGLATIVDDHPAVASILADQVADLEPHTASVHPSGHGAMLGAIRAIVVEVTTVRAKMKYGANVDQSHRRHVAQLLGDRDGPGDAAALRQLQI